MIKLTETHHIALEPITLGVQLIDLVEHPIEQSFCRTCRYPGALELPDLAALAVNLGPHAFDLEVDVRHVISLDVEPAVLHTAPKTMGHLPLLC